LGGGGGGDGGVGLGAHTDWGYLTIPTTDASGLQLEDPYTGDWVDVPPMQGRFLIHVGDVLEYETNGACRSPVHRVSIPRNENEKHSIVFFCEPSPSSTLLGTSKPAITYWDFVQAKTP